MVRFALLFRILDKKLTMKDYKQISLVQTCSACPEQYDAFYNDKKVGYLRLRHGVFTVEYPECGGKLICIDHPFGDGSFHDKEREIYLDKARVLIWKELNKEDSKKELNNHIVFIEQTLDHLEKKFRDTNNYGTDEYHMINNSLISLNHIKSKIK